MIKYKAFEEPAGAINNEKDENGWKEPEVSADKPMVTRCEVDASKVENEIKQLKVRRQELQRQLGQGNIESGRRKELEQQLAAVEAELGIKDTDAYKKQTASYSFSSEG